MPNYTHIKGVYINTPCHENWNAMTDVEKGRFCNQCSKIVYDFTEVGPEEFFKIYRENKGQICGWFNAKPLSFWSVAKNNLVHTLRQNKAAIVALGMVVLSFGYTKAQQAATNYSFGRLKVISMRYQLRSTVADESISSFAKSNDSNTFITLSFKIKDKNTEELILKKITVDVTMSQYELSIKEINNGMATFQIPAEMVNDSTVIKVSGEDYETRRLELTNSINIPDVYLKDSAKAQTVYEELKKEREKRYKRRWWQFWKPQNRLKVMGCPTF